MKKVIAGVLCLGFIWTFVPVDGICGGRVLVVQSYHKEYDWVQGINETIEGILSVHGVRYRVYYMDTKRRSSMAWKKESARLAKEMIAAYKPHVVIAVDDNAQHYVVKDFVNASDIQFVFCGVNADPNKYGYPASNVTGLLERTYPDQTMRTLKTLLPRVERVAVVSDDSATSALVLPRIKQLTTSTPGNYEAAVVSYDQPSTFSQWQKTILRLDKDPKIDALLLPLYHTVRKDGSNRSMESADVLRWTVAHTAKPLVGLWPRLVTDGGFMSVTVDPREHGRVAANMALDILGGKRASQIPMAVNKEGKVLINLKNTGHFFFNISIDIDQVADVVIR